MKKKLLQLLTQHLSEYPQAQSTDMLKLLYQNEFGPGHLICDPQEGLRRLAAEYALLAPEHTDRPAVEPIGNGLCRLHLRLLAQSPLQIETFSRFFELSAVRLRGSREGFLHKAQVFEELCQVGALPFSSAQVRGEIEAWEAQGGNAFRHSALFREQYHPAYRVVEEQFCDFLVLFCQIDALLQKKERLLVALDGHCAAGKTTLAALLRLVYGCSVVPMDHFFLRPQQRTPERLAQPGGNVDYERFLQEALHPLHAGQSFSYRPYLCSQGVLGAPIHVSSNRISIVEGSYSLHPALSDFYDLKVFLSVDPAEQMRRIRVRNGAQMCRRFEEEWIPLENRYFHAFSIKKQCQLQFTNGKCSFSDTIIGI